ncbi:MAG: hypothetical protein K6E26_08135 [Clostridiales bacterium]|nr:hypothetical protein [Clostridiales bacterium]MCR5275317.1 hypothetical protein [Clostridiales bacterium]
MNRVYFDIGVFTYWSDEALESKRLVSKGGVLVSDDEALAGVRDGSEQIDSGLVDMLRNLSEEGYDLNICDTRPVSEIKDMIVELGIGSFFHQIISAATAEPLAKSLQKIRGKEDFSLFVGCNGTVIDACDRSQIPVIAYGEQFRKYALDAFSYAMYPLEIEDEIATLWIVHSVARRTIEKNARVLGIDGIEFSGRKVFTSKLAKYFELLGKEYDVVELEDYHRAVEASYKGEDPVESFYFNGFNTEKLITEVLKPFSKTGTIDKVVYCLDSSNDSFVNERYYSLSEDGVMILIGTMMYREPLKRYFDVTVYIRCDYREAEHRASLVETPLYGEDPVEVYRTKHIPAQKMYVSRHDPMAGRDFVIDNSNYHRPFLVK